MRVFLAIPVPDLIRQYARQMRKDLSLSKPDIKWVEYDNYHLTVKFLGDVNISEVTAIKKQMGNVSDSCTSFKLHTGGIGFFPNQIRPRVIWLGMKGELDKAFFLGDRVDQYLYPLGFEPEKNRRFHLTLGRFRSDNNIDDMMIKVKDFKPKDMFFMVNEFRLMESKLTSKGPVYTILESFTLNG